MSDAATQTTTLAEAMYGPLYPYVNAMFGVIKEIAVLAAVAIPLQLLLPAVKRGGSTLLRYELWLDVLYWLIGAALAFTPFTLALDFAVTHIYGDARWFPALGSWPAVAQVAICVWLFDFLVYWRHRLEHRLRPLWSYHAVHHTAENLEFLTTSRVHPLELFVGGVINVLPAAIGFNPVATSIAFAIYLHWNYFIHLNVRIKAPGFLRYLFVTPFMHHWHHTNDPKAIDKNYAVVFAFHDWLFGTAHHPEHWPTGYGLASEPNVGHSYVKQLFYPVLYAISVAREAMRKKAAAAAPAE